MTIKSTLSAPSLNMAFRILLLGYLVTSLAQVTNSPTSQEKDNGFKFTIYGASDPWDAHRIIITTLGIITGMIALPYVLTGQNILKVSKEVLKREYHDYQDRRYARQRDSQQPYQEHLLGPEDFIENPQNNLLNIDPIRRDVADQQQNQVNVANNPNILFARPNPANNNENNNDENQERPQNFPG